MKHLSKILLWQIPQRYFRAFCGVGGGLLFLAALYLGFSGHGQSALMFLLLGAVGLSGALGRKTRTDFMKTNTVQKTATFKISPIFLLLSPFVILLMSYNFQFSGVLWAIFFTAMVYSSPDIFCTRTGSLVPAICLAVFMWLCAAVVFVLSFFGAH